MSEKLTKKECFEILDKYRHWNVGQKSISLAFGGVRTTEDEILEMRRQLILNATKRLNGLCE